MSGITTHVLDTSLGKPAAGVPVVLEVRDGNATWRTVGEGATDDDGRLHTLMPGNAAVVSGVYRLVFDSARYFANGGVAGFFPSVTIEFAAVADGHYHVPLLLSPYGYSTYRGS
jgi:5-hydroxyisourate hydrolase